MSRFDFPTEAHAHLFLAGAVRDLVEREPQASVAVIAHAAEVARAFHRLLADLPEARLALDGRFTFRPGVDVTDVASVKGLEFDYVIVPDASARAYPDERRGAAPAPRGGHARRAPALDRGPGNPSPLLAAVPADVVPRGGRGVASGRTAPSARLDGARHHDILAGRARPWPR